MFKKNDPYTYSTLVPLWDNSNDSSGISTQIGTAYLEYQATRYENVQVEDASSTSNNSISQFILVCTQTINIFNATTNSGSTSRVQPPLNLGPPFANYPALVNTTVQPESLPGITFQALKYSPQTLNSTVQTSQAITDSNGVSSSNSSSNTVGSSFSQTNSYGGSVSVSATAGLFDASVSGTVSADFNNANTNSSDNSSTIGTDSSKNANEDSYNSSSMSIKDWGSYATVIIAADQQPTLSWTFGQEYPWDAIQCQNLNTSSKNLDNSNQYQVYVPVGMSARLYDVTSGTILPPSQLSLFGFIFVTSVQWLVTIDDSAFVGTLENGDAFNIQMNHIINYVTASHSVDGDNSLNVYMDSQATTLANSNMGGLTPTVTNTTNLDLFLMALDPIGTQSKPAIIGFIPNKFIIQPAPFPNLTYFKTISTTNNLQILDTTSYSTSSTVAGFSCTNNFMTATFDSGTPILQMTIYFKVIDAVSNYTLYMKHWISEAGGIELTFTINGNNPDLNTSFTKYVTEPLSKGGDNNLLSVSLRNLDFTNDDYNDYLQLGLNSIQVSITPMSGQSFDNFWYAIRALSIE